MGKVNIYLRKYQQQWKVKPNKIKVNWSEVFVLFDKKTNHLTIRLVDGNMVGGVHGFSVNFQTRFVTKIIPKLVSVIKPVSWTDGSNEVQGKIIVFHKIWYSAKINEKFLFQ